MKIVNFIVRRLLLVGLLHWTSMSNQLDCFTRRNKCPREAEVAANSPSIFDFAGQFYLGPRALFRRSYSAFEFKGRRQLAVRTQTGTRIDLVRSILRTMEKFDQTQSPLLLFMSPRASRLHFKLFGLVAKANSASNCMESIWVPIFELYELEKVS